MLEEITKLQQDQKVCDYSRELILVAAYIYKKWHRCIINKVTVDNVKVTGFII